jgi:hypothetical protein
LSFFEQRTFFVSGAFRCFLTSTLRDGDHCDTGLLTGMLIFGAGETAIGPLACGGMTEERLMTLERGEHMLLIIGISF